MNKHKYLYVLGILALLISFQSCATIFGHKHNSLVFESEVVSGAQVFIDDTLVGQAQGKLVLPKQVIQHGSLLEIRAEGYKTQQYTIIRKVHPWYTLADILTGGVPLLVDFADGNILRPSPRKFAVELEKEEN